MFLLQSKGHRSPSNFSSNFLSRATLKLLSISRIKKMSFQVASFWTSNHLISTLDQLWKHYDTVGGAFVTLSLRHSKVCEKWCFSLPFKLDRNHLWTYFVFACWDDHRQRCLFTWQVGNCLGYRELMAFKVKLLCDNIVEILGHLSSFSLCTSFRLVTKLEK